MTWTGQDGLDGKGGDTALAARLVEGDERAFEVLFDRHARAVRSAAARVLRDEALAEDVVQETFSRLWTAPETFSPDRGSLRSYLVTIAHRRAVDVIRSEVARHRREQRPPEPDHSSVEEEALAGSVAEVVRAALDRLPAEEREPIALAYLRGLTYVEVARHLGKPEGTVKSRIRSGMRHLSKILADSV